MGRLLTLMTLMILGALAQDDKPSQANRLLWRFMPHDVKVAYVDGVTDGLTEGLSWCRGRPTGPDIAGNSTSADVAKEIDAFYEDEANVSLPMITAFRYAHMKLTNASEQRLKDFLIGARGVNQAATNGILKISQQPPNRLTTNPK